MSAEIRNKHIEQMYSKEYASGECIPIQLSEEEWEKYRNLKLSVRDKLDKIERDKRYKEGHR